MSKYIGWRDKGLETQLKQSIKIAKANKYNAKRVQIDGIWFDSKAESKRYNELKLMEKAGLITAFCIHPRFSIEYLNQPICVVELDFAYLDKDGNRHREDVKSRATNTALSKLKRKLVEAFYGIHVELIGL